MTEGSFNIRVQSTFPDIALEGIKRISLKDSAAVEIIRIESPSSLFVRPVDHLRQSLVYREPLQLAPLEQIFEGSFALAPLEERLFGRCMIVKNFEDHQCCRVFFIDEAITADVSYPCLFQLNENQRSYPWQVMQISLGRIVPLSEEGWSSEHRSQFSQILSEYDNFEITACQVDLDDDPYRPSLLVNLYGLNGTELDTKVGIEELCLSRMTGVMLSMNSLNIMENSLLSELDDNMDCSVEEFRKTLPADWIHEYPPNTEDEDDDWDIDTLFIPDWDLKSLENYRTTDDRFYGFVEPESIVSVSEFHVFPLYFEAYNNDENWLFTQYSKKTDYLKALEDFYSMTKNQRPLELEEIKSALERGRVYAMVSVQHKKRADSTWLRCEVFDITPSNNISVHYLDTGRKGFEKPKNMYRMHKMHTRRSLTIGICGKFEKTMRNDCNSDVSSEDLYELNEVLPYDIPLLLGPHIEMLPNGKLLVRDPPSF